MINTRHWPDLKAAFWLFGQKCMYVNVHIELEHDPAEPNPHPNPLSPIGSIHSSVLFSMLLNSKHSL